MCKTLRPHLPVIIHTKQKWINQEFLASELTLIQTFLFTSHCNFLNAYVPTISILTTPKLSLLGTYDVLEL